MKSDMQNRKTEDQWVADILATLTPPWESDPVRSRDQLTRAMSQPSRTKFWMPATALATAACFAALVLLPAPRAIAQRLWNRLTISRVEVIRLDLSALPFRSEISSNGLPVAVENFSEASEKLGFRPNPRLLGMFSSVPELTVIGPMEVRQTIHVAALEAALAKAGASPVRVPPEWEGVTLRVDLKPTLAVEYPDALILESLPMELSIPAGFPLEHFAELAFQSIGVPFAQARAMGRRFAAHPAWFLDLRPDEPVSVQEIDLPSGPAILIEDPSERKASERVMIIWTTGDRLHAVSSTTLERAKALALSLP